MTSKTIADFFQQVDRDPALKAKLERLPGTDRDGGLAHVVKVASDAGYVLRRDELEREIDRHAGSGELSPQELDRVVGGASIGTTASFSWLTSLYKPVGVIGPCDKPVGAVGPCFTPKGVIAPCD